MDNNKPIGFYFDFELKNEKNIILFIVIVAIILGVIFFIKNHQNFMILS